VTHVESKPIGWLGWLWRAAVAGLLVLSVMGDVEAMVAIPTKVSLNSAQSLGVEFGPSAVREARWVGVAQVQPRSAAAAAGIRSGDSLRFDTFLGHVIAWRPGERVSVTVSRDGRRFPATIAVGAPTDYGGGAAVAINLLLAVQSLGVIGLAGLLLMRGWRNRAASLLATFLALAFCSWPTYWLPRSAVVLLDLLIVLGSAIVMHVWLLFCLEISGGPSSRRQARMVVAAGLALSAAWFYSVLAGLWPLPLPGSGPLLSPTIIVLVNVVGYAIFAANYSRNDAPGRNRIRIVALAFVFFLMARLTNDVGGSMARAGVPLAQLVWLACGMTLLEYAGPILLMYAVLRRQLFDLGFALNRTLVYGAVSFILLACFGLAEWAADHLIPESWRQASALYSAGIALLLFLSVHRLRDVVERQVERLFFHRWQQNEASLRRFVAAAGHFDQTPALCRAFAEEASRFTEGGPAALYLRGSGGEYRLQCGRMEGAPEACAEDDSAFALMRAERRPVDLATAHGGMPGALALPMLDQGVLAGFVLVGPKPDGADYRPDEVDLLGWAANQVGLDLQALHARDLEAQVVSLNEKVAWLSEDKARLTALLNAGGGLQPASPAG
jgi:hypothetical protein